jgi:hypothetical protein
VNLALPTLVILLGLLPGIACFYGYFAGRFDKRTVGVSGVEQLALFAIFAVPIDAAALWIVQAVGESFNYDVAIHLLMGTASDTAVHSEIVEFFQANTIRSAVMYGVILFVAFALGSFGRRLVWACRLDTRIPYLHVKHEWFYILQGRLKRPRRVLAYVDVMTRLPEEKDGPQTRLYRGLVIDFELSTSGSLESLTLKNAFRGSGRREAFTWKEIPSTRLLIMGSTIHSINITYVGVEENLLFGARARLWLKSFFHETE